MMRHSVFNNPELPYLVYLQNNSVYSKWLLYSFFGAAFFCLGFFLFEKQGKMFVMIFLILNLFNLGKIITPKLTFEASKEKSNNQAQIVLKNKKNIYFILTDSLTSINGLKTLGIKNDHHQFLGELEQKGFVHYPDFYTSLQATQYALFTYFNLSYKYQELHGYQVDPILRLRHILNDGKLYDIFRDNGYKINIMHELDVFLLDNCSADLCYFNVTNKLRPSLSSIKEKVLSIISFLSPINVSALFKEEKKVLFFDPNELAYNDRNAFITETIQKLKQLNLDHPNFTYIHAFTFPAHSDTNSETINHCNEAEEIQKYSQRITSTSQFVLAMVDTIRARDKNAIIIIAGDHGPYIFKQCTREGIQNPEDVIERQGAFLSILWGDGYDGKYNSRIKSSHNLFRYVLSYLAENEVLLKNIDKDHAFTLYNNQKIGRTITDGSINKKIVIVPHEEKAA
ncbi:sulfatase-like hydrolase/transferase [Legionella sp. WA2022007384]